MRRPASVLSPKTAVEYIDHILDAYEFGDIDPVGSICKLRELRDYFQSLLDEDFCPIAD